MIKSISLSTRRATMALFVFVAMAFGAVSVSHAMAGDSGTWVNKQYQINGAWEIDNRNGQTVIRFKDGFKTKGGPDLKVFLSKSDISNVTGKNATQNATFLAKLKSTNGNQEYVLPQGLNIDDYASLLIHCEAFSVLWGGANI